MSVSADEMFFSTATQYYIAGRFAAFAGLLPVVGNLFHHAIEMYLKGGLSKTKTLAELKDLGHNLPGVWSEFKAEFVDPTLAQFDGVVSALRLSAREGHGVHGQHQAALHRNHGQWPGWFGAAVPPLSRRDRPVGGQDLRGGIAESQVLSRRA